MGRMDTRSKKNHWLIALVISILLLIAARLIYLHWINVQKNKHQKTAVPVVLGTVQTGDMPVYVGALGTVTPLETVTVRTQINGTLLRVLFKEGQVVKAGDLLAEIDPRTYEAQ